MSQPTNFRTVGQTMRKKDSMQLLLGKGVYTDDIVRSRSPLVVKLLRSPHANAIVQSIRTDIAKKVPGVVDVYTWEDVPQKRFAIAGQTFPEPSPYDRLILDRHVRFVGDAVAIVAAEDEKAAQKALKLIKVEYQVLEPLLDFRTAKDNPLLVHPEEDWFPPCPVGGDNRRNLVASGLEQDGDVDAVMADCDIVIDRTYHTRAFNQAMMELGATLCGPNTAPQCGACPVRSLCLGLQRGTAAELPVKKPKKGRRMEEKTVFLLIRDGKIALRKRPKTGLLAGLWEFPNVEGALNESAAGEAVETMGLTPIDWRSRLTAKHIFTHVEWHMTGYALTVRGSGPAELEWVDQAGLAERSVPSAFARYYEEANDILKEN